MTLQFSIGIAEELTRAARPFELLGDHQNSN